MDVNYFRAQVKGPEAELESVLIPQLEDIFPDREHHYWAGAYVPIGASRPDILVADYHPDIASLCDIPAPATKLLGCLKMMPRARVKTLSSVAGMKEKIVSDYLTTLSMVGVVIKHSNSYSLASHWRNILPTVISIELKVKNWRKAVYQAITNRAFTHMTFIALPSRMAERVKSEEVLSRFGIGVLSISEDRNVKLIRKARRSKPQVWPYYYRLASYLASDFKR